MDRRGGPDAEMAKRHGGGTAHAGVGMRERVGESRCRRRGNGSHSTEGSRSLSAFVRSSALQTVEVVLEGVPHPVDPINYA